MDKRAAVYVAIEARRDFISIMKDAGFDGLAAQGCWFVVSGDLLPDECAEPELKEVNVTFTEERYGSQKLVKVSGISVVGPVSANDIFFRAPAVE